MSVPGRQVELARMEAACRAARSGAGQLVLITGEAGIGKSRLAQAVAEDAAATGMASARGWCMDDPGAPTLWPWRRVARDVPGLGSTLDAVADVEASDEGRYRLVDGVSSALEATAGNGIVIVLEDVHWADSFSLDLLRRLLPEISTLPLLFVATAREDGLAGTPFERVLPELVRAPNTRHVPLTGLTSEAVTEWLAQSADTSEWAAHADDLVRLTGGNPFYIQSLTTELSARPGLEVSSALAERPTWRAVLVAAFRALPEPARHTVATAAILGEHLSPRLLAEALDRSVDEVSDHLSAAVTSGILHFGETGLAFNHALIRDAIAAELGPAERERAHAGLAAALEATHDPLMTGVAAMHWSRVEGHEAAAHCRDLAAAAATAPVLAPDRGVQLARLALESARTLGVGEEELAERLLTLTRLQWAAGLIREALASCGTGIDAAEAVGRPDLMASFALVPQGVGSADVAYLAGRMGRRALALLAASETTTRARLLALCAIAAAEAAQAPREPRAAGDETESPAALSAEALAAARASGDPQAELETIAARHYVLSYPQAIAERAALAARAVELAPAASTTMGALWGHLWQADLAFQQGDVAAVQQAATDVERVAERRSSPVARWHALRLRSSIHVLHGRFTEARATAREAGVLAERIGDVAMIGMHHAFRVQLARLRGDPTELLPGVFEILHRAPTVPLVRASLPLIHALRGDLGEARAHFAALRDIPARMPLGPRWFGTVGQIGFAAVAVGDAGVARECYRLLLPCAQWCAGDGGGAPFAGGSNQLTLGEFAMTFGDLALAAGHFERGIAVDDRVGARPYAALGRLHLARCHEHEDPMGSKELATAAAAELDRLDMPGPLAQAVSLLDRLAGSAGSRMERPGGLTEREFEVAQLVGQAMTNRRIADRLFLSVRTVESHVRSALAKLGLASRTELAVWVRETPP